MISRITLDFKISNCQYRCMHCDGAKNDFCGDLSLSKIKEVANKFSEHRGSLLENLFVFISDSAFLFREYIELLEYLEAHNMRYKKEPVNGVRFDRMFYTTIFPKIAASSLDTVRISLFGMETNHNIFAGYERSFGELMGFAKAFNDLNKELIFHLYLTPNSIRDIETLENYLSTEFNRYSITYEYSNCYKENYSKRANFLLSISQKKTAEKYGLSLVTEAELRKDYIRKVPKLWHNNLWLRVFSNGDCHVAIFPLGEFHSIGNVNYDSAEIIISKRRLNPRPKDGALLMPPGRGLLSDFRKIVTAEMPCKENKSIYCSPFLRGH
jgi:hypothetical protein